MGFADYNLTEAAPEGGGEKVDVYPPDGDHVSTLVGASAFVAKSDGKEYVRLSWREEASGAAWSVLQNFTPAAIPVTKKIMIQLGVDNSAVTTLEDLDTQLKLQVGNYYNTTIKTVGQWTNTYVNGRAGAAAFSGPSLDQAMAAGQKMPWDE
jgi:hypothetical protein